MKIYNKTNLFIGFVLMVVPNWIQQYQNIYLWLMQSLGLVLIILAFIRPRKTSDKQGRVKS